MNFASKKRKRRALLVAAVRVPPSHDHPPGIMIRSADVRVALRRSRSVGGWQKVMVLGIDGMDPKLLQTFVDQGRMPNFKP